MLDPQELARVLPVDRSAELDRELEGDSRSGFESMNFFLETFRYAHFVYCTNPTT